MNILGNMRLGKRLAVGFGICAGLTLLMTFSAWWGITAMDKAAESRKLRLRRTVLAQSVETDMARIGGIILALADDIDSSKRTHLQEELEKTRENYK